MLVVLLALAALTTTALDYLVFEVWVPEAFGLGVGLLLLAAWTATRSTWAPAIVGCIAALVTVANLLSPFVGPRLFDPEQFAFFVTTWVATAAGLLAAPVGVTETLRQLSRGNAPSGDGAPVEEAKRHR